MPTGSKSKYNCRLGEFGELQFAAEAVKNGLCVSFPHGHGHSFDFLVLNELGNTSRIQVKYTSERNGKSYSCTVRSYKPGVDFYAIYTDPEFSFYIIPKEAMPSCSRMTLNSRFKDYKEAWNLIKEF